MGPDFTASGALAPAFVWLKHVAALITHATDIMILIFIIVISFLSAVEGVFPKSGL
jgi:hypothetical protein